MAVSSVSVGHINDKGTFVFGGTSTDVNYENHTDGTNGKEEIIKGGTGTAYAPGATLNMTGVKGEAATVVLYAQWENMYETITLSFDTNGEGTIEPLSVKVKKGEAAEFKMPFVDLETTEYALEGWLTAAPANKILDRNANAPEGLYLPGEPKVKFDKNTTLHAIYRYTTSGSGGGGSDPGTED